MPDQTLYTIWVEMDDDTSGAPRRDLLCPLNGVRPCGWTESGWRFDHLPGVLILELGWTEIAQRGM